MEVTGLDVHEKCKHICKLQTADRVTIKLNRVFACCSHIKRQSCGTRHCDSAQQKSRKSNFENNSWTQPDNPSTDNRLACQLHSWFALCWATTGAISSPQVQTRPDHHDNDSPSSASPVGRCCMAFAPGSQMCRWCEIAKRCDQNQIRTRRRSIR